MSTPTIPPRPQRSSAKSETPSIPPRPVRKTDPSPDREAFTRSPLNFPPTALGNTKNLAPSGRTSDDLPRRPPSVSLPDIGHEGDEYSSFDQLPAEAHGVSGEQTKNVSADLPMHQPIASVPQSTAKRQIHTVTSTDSTQAAAAGIGRSRPADDVHKMPPQDAGVSMRRVTSNEPRRAPSVENQLRAKASFNRSSSSLQPLERTTSRPGSVHGDDFEHGIPEIGQQIPLNRWAGDAQAPSPALAQPQHSAGIGFFNDGSSRAHHRKRSSRHEFGPPDSYGIRHDQDRQDQFEQEWIRKHPQEAAKEGFHHTHLPKPETALTSEQLNRLIHGDASYAAALAPGTPDEEIAFETTEEYLSRTGTPQDAATDRKQRTSGAEKAGFPLQERKSLHPEDALADEAHASPSRRQRLSRVDIDDEHEHENLDGAPILASDEIIKRPSSAFMHAAVVPEPHPDDYDSDHSVTARRNSSRPSSRPSSVHGAAVVNNYTGGSLHRFISHDEHHHSGHGTPLEEIEEYEPLFPEDEEDGKQVRQKILKKRPDLSHHHFPSQDVWEDTPDSLQYSTTVSTPDLERTQEQAQTTGASASAVFEPPEQEEKRKAENEDDMLSDKKTFIKPHFKPGVLEEFHHERPSPHRFPSSDVWEDTPDSARIETTVSGPQEDEMLSPTDGRSMPGAFPGGQDDDDSGSTSTGLPAIPSRPQRQSRLAQEVSPDEDSTSARSPEKTKPAVPARPARIGQSEQSRSAEDGDAPVPKAKPAVPARPGGEKLASLKAGFMNDLNNRLKLGPQGPPAKKEEPEVDEEAEKAPLADARKSRAKGPPRRKPAAPPASDRKSSVTFAMSPLITVWSIDEEDEVQVNDKETEDTTAPTGKPVEIALSENAEFNIDAAVSDKGPLSPQEVATSISSADRPGTAAGQHRGSTADLEAALAAIGAGPAKFESRDDQSNAAVIDGTNDQAVDTSTPSKMEDEL
ncbi:unnamed protein product [Zymoseptoria tritici ST99CH_3D1]|nr:unnamed protein product [Zymoseptoria tritici ST99CH_3D1]